LKFKQLISGALAATLITTSVFAAEYPVGDAVYERDTAIQRDAGAFRGGFDVERRTFDNIVDQMYYDVFGTGFEFMQRNSQTLDQVATYGNLRMEVLSAIVVGGDTLHQYDFHEGTREVTRSPEPVFRAVEGFTFVSLIDTTGANAFDERMNMVFAQENFDPDRRYGVFSGGARFLFQDEASGAGIFVIQHHGTVLLDATSVDIGFTVQTIMSGFSEISERIDVSIAAMLAGHEATTTILAGADVGGWGASWGGDGERTFGEGFDATQVDHTVLVKDELNVALDANIYLSNIALIGNMLHVQLNEFSTNFVNMAVPDPRWAHVSLVDFSDTDTEFFPWDAMLHADLFLDLSDYDENFNLVNDRRYSEFIHIIDDLSRLENVYFMLTGGYFSNISQTNLSFDSVSMPINLQRVELDAIDVVTSEATGARSVTLSNIVITPLGISFHMTGDSIDFTNTADEFFFTAHDAVAITFTNADGTTVEYRGMGGGFGFLGDYPNFEGLIVFHRGAIDMDSLVSISFSGTVVTL